MDDDNYYYVNFMKINNGMIIGSETIKVKKKISFNYSEIVQILTDLKIKYGSIENETISNISFEKYLPEDLSSYVPKVGDKKKPSACTKHNSTHALHHSPNAIAFCATYIILVPICFSRICSRNK